jgi:hypothetical protein
MPSEESRAIRKRLLEGDQYSVYYTTPDSGRVRAKSWGIGTSGHANYLMHEGAALEQARELMESSNVSRVEIVLVHPAKNGKTRGYTRRPPRRRA